MKRNQSKSTKEINTNIDYYNNMECFSHANRNKKPTQEYLYKLFGFHGYIHSQFDIKECGIPDGLAIIDVKANLMMKGLVDENIIYKINGNPIHTIRDVFYIVKDKRRKDDLLKLEVKVIKDEDKLNEWNPKFTKDDFENKVFYIKAPSYEAIDKAVADLVKYRTSNHEVGKRVHKKNRK